MTLPIDRIVAAGPACVHFDAEMPTAAELTEKGLEVREIDGTAISDRDELLDAVAKALEFPDYFGGNWDALEEMLRDLSWLPAKGYALIVRDATAVWGSAPRAAGGLIESWLFCAAHWAASDTPFHLAFEW